MNLSNLDNNLSDSDEGYDSDKSYSSVECSEILTFREFSKNPRGVGIYLSKCLQNHCNIENIKFKYTYANDYSATRDTHRSSSWLDIFINGLKFTIIEDNYSYDPGEFIYIDCGDYRDTYLSIKEFSELILAYVNLITKNEMNEEIINKYPDVKQYYEKNLHKIKEYKRYKQKNLLLGCILNYTTVLPLELIQEIFSNIDFEY